MVFRFRISPTPHPLAYYAEVPATSFPSEVTSDGNSCRPSASRPTVSGYLRWECADGKGRSPSLRPTGEESGSQGWQMTAVVKPADSSPAALRGGRAMYVRTPTHNALAGWTVRQMRLATREAGLDLRSRGGGVRPSG
jgi:hypothetical protein